MRTSLEISLGRNPPRISYKTHSDFLGVSISIPPEDSSRFKSAFFQEVEILPWESSKIPGFRPFSPGVCHGDPTEYLSRVTSRSFLNSPQFLVGVDDSFAVRSNDENSFPRIDSLFR